MAPFAPWRYDLAHRYQSFCQLQSTDQRHRRQWRPTVTALIPVYGGDHRATFLRHKQMLEHGGVLLELRMHLKENGSARNHGSAFRIQQNRIRDLYLKVSQLRPKSEENRWDDSFGKKSVRKSGSLWCWIHFDALSCIYSESL